MSFWKYAAWICTAETLALTSTDTFGTNEITIRVELRIKIIKFKSFREYVQEAQIVVAMQCSTDTLQVPKKKKKNSHFCSLADFNHTAAQQYTQWHAVHKKTRHWQNCRILQWRSSDAKESSKPVYMLTNLKMKYPNWVDMWSSEYPGLHSQLSDLFPRTTLLCS